MRLTLALAAAVVAVSSLGAVAAEKCTTTPKSGWKPQEAALEKAKSLGYTTSKVKEEDGCWEVYAKKADGSKLELFFNPVTLDLVRTKAM